MNLVQDQFVSRYMYLVIYEQPKSILSDLWSMNEKVVDLQYHYTYVTET